MRRKWRFKGIIIHYKNNTKQSVEDFELIDLETGFTKVLDKSYKLVCEEIHDILYNTARGEEIYRIELSNVHYLDGKPGPGTK